VVDDALLSSAAEHSGIPRHKILDALFGFPPPFERWTHEMERGTAAARKSPAELCASDELILHSFAACPDGSLIEIGASKIAPDSLAVTIRDYALESPKNPSNISSNLSSPPKVNSVQD